jgi:hypothetical protein
MKYEYWELFDSLHAWRHVLCSRLTDRQYHRLHRRHEELLKAYDRQWEIAFYAKASSSL